MIDTYLRALYLTVPAIIALLAPLTASRADEATTKPAETQAEARQTNEATTTDSTKTELTREEMLSVLETDHVMGNPDAPVTIIEYASLSCPHCAAFHHETFPELKKEFIDTGKARFIFRHFPFNAPALHGSMLTECAGDEKFFTYLKVLFNTQKTWAFTEDYMKVLETTAKLGGMSEDDFKSCMADKAVEQRVLQDRQHGYALLKITSTPSFFVNGKLLKGNQPVSKFEEIITSATATTAE